MKIRKLQTKKFYNIGLAYHAVEFIRVVKSFVIQAPGLEPRGKCYETFYGRKL
jgi:hypothetical protein